MTADNIIIQGARTNNLKGIDVAFKKHAITVVTGVSGSGKSSLVFSTLAAESQRQVNKTYSTYIQNLLPKFAQPQVDRIQNLPFSIVVTQKPMTGNARSTVGTYSELYTGLRLLFSRIARPFIGYSMTYSFNSPSGMCPRCEGLGVVKEIDIDALLDRSLTLNQGAIQFPTFQSGGWRLTRYTESGFFNIELPLKDWPEEQLNLLMYGGEQVPPHPTDQWHKTVKYIGVIPRIDEAFIRKQTSKYTKELAGVTTTATCPECNGSRVNATVRSAKINGTNIAECSEMDLPSLRAWLQEISAPSAGIIQKELIGKIDSLISVGLEYLTLNRTTTTLSGGEAQRLKLANYLNSPLSDVLYIFDEPSVGLHPHDLIGINKVFRALRDSGNTVVIVDHDPDVIKIADEVIDLGDKAGADGGHIAFQGSYRHLLVSNTLTGNALRNPGDITTVRQVYDEWYPLKDVSYHNVHHASVAIPKHTMTVVTGVAGSGKSTLIRDLFAGYYTWATVLDQKPPHTSVRSNILTYLEAFDPLRQAFAKATGKSASWFSFNGKGGCPVCKGKGIIKLDLAYMGDVSVTCEACDGKRYNPDVLKLIYRDNNIAEALDLTVGQAATIYPDIIGDALSAMNQVGLSYLKVGQSLDTLSGGELQRLKLAKQLLTQTSDLLILDEPTSGLHEANVQSMIDLLKLLVYRHRLTIIVIEHNLRVMGQANWLIDMGPGAGVKGGRILFAGTPGEILSKPIPTGIALRQYYQIDNK